MSREYGVDSNITFSSDMNCILVNNYHYSNDIVLYGININYLNTFDMSNTVGIWKLKYLKNEKTK